MHLENFLKANKCFNYLTLLLYLDLMKIKSIGFLAFGMTLMMTSCFKDEPLNAECDIEQVILHSTAAESVFFNMTDTIQNVLYTDSTIKVNVRSNAPLETVTPEFVLTPGATVQCVDGDVKEGRAVYVVTSEDGNWNRRYVLSLVPTTVTVSDTLKYDFEHYELDPTYQKFYVWHNTLSDGSLGNDWATGNAGFKISMSTAKPEDYPSVPITGGFDGSAIKLTTRDTGPFGVMVGKRIAAGNFFLGSFDVVNALKDAMKATRFGIPFDRKPVKLTGYYKFKAGATYIDQQGKPVAGKTDNGDIYAVFYRNHDDAGNLVMLYGDDVKTNPHIVAITKVNPVQETDEWTFFEIEFNYSKDVNLEVLENRGYSLTIVFSSSIDGAVFQGAVGSELCVDKVRLICTREE